jgi:protein-S-isoprenylcysteine O-methyltransferase Ste14
MQGRALYIFTVIQIVAVILMFWFVFTWRSPWNVERFVGTALAVIGVCGIVLARYQLGRSFSVTAQAHSLVTTGIYAKIRNPIYVFGGVMIAGLLLIVHKPVLWILFIILVIGQTLRARHEARVLEAAFGDAYRDYRRKTWF